MGRIVKVMGERNTGTRAMQGLLRQVPGVTHRVAPRSDVPEYDAALEAAVDAQLKGHWKRLYLHAMRDDIAARGMEADPWKHALPRLGPAMVAAGVATILMVRNPYSWLIALARRPYHLKGPNATTLEEFAARPWLTEAREGMCAVLPSPLALWSQKAAATLAYLRAAEAAGLPARIVRFEDFVADPGGVAARSFEALGLPPTALRVRERNTKAEEAPLATLQAYYRAETWQTRLTRETVARVNAQVDWQVAAALGYARLDPARFPVQLCEDVSRQIRAEMASLSAPSHGEASPAAAT